MKSGEGNPAIININGLTIKVNYPGKIFWKTENIDKMEMVEYYKTISPYMFPYVQNRPVTLHYFPRGIDKISFYKRNFSKPVPDMIDIYPYREISRDKTIQVPIISSSAGIVYLAAKACVEFHSWASTITNIYHPDLAIFDLDVADNQNFDKVLTASKILHDFLKDKGLISFAKTTGGSGMHIYLPIKPIYDFHTVKEWVKQVSLLLSKQFPEIFTGAEKSNKTHESDKIVIDYRQNIITRNTATVYTLRAFDGAPVSCPVEWNEIFEKSFVPADFTIKTVPGRLRKKGDLFAGLLKYKQVLPKL
jgi:bifunctional non-homologous end joining protein LigD